MESTIGIDAGGTLTKIAYLDEQRQLAFEKFYSNEQDKIIDWLKKTLVKSKYVLQVVKKELQQLLSNSYKIVELNEFEATLIGVRYILKRREV